MHLLVEGVDERAAMHLDRDPALALERDQRLAHRDAADAQSLCDLLLGDPLARAEPAVEDEAPDVDDRVLPAALPRRMVGGRERLAWCRGPLAHRRHDCIRYARCRTSGDLTCGNVLGHRGRDTRVTR